jgi:Domain of unknown function (DUF4398)
MSFRRSVVSILVLLAFSSLACGGDPPDKEMQQAQNAIDQARAAGADRYAVEEYTAAVDALKNAHTAVEQRDYRLALNDALDSKERAENSAKLAVEGKAAARSAADKALIAANSSVNAAEGKVKAANAARVSAHALAEAKSALDEAQSHLQEARTAFNSGDYYAALSAASATTQSAKAATDKLEVTPASPTRRRSGTR